MINTQPVTKVNARLIPCVESDNDNLRQSSCVVLISVGQPAHEGDKFAATINTVNKRFASCMIAVCDSLQRHSLKLGTDCSSDEILQISRDLGREWFARNRRIIEELNIPYKVCYWDQWLKRSDFSHYQSIVIRSYDEDEKFKLAMDSTVEEFVTRFNKRRVRPVCVDEIREASLQYLIEECAIIMLMWQDRQFNHIVYPSDMIEVMRSAYEKFVSPYHKNILQWMRIKLKTKRDIAFEINS